MIVVIAGRTMVPTPSFLATNTENTEDEPTTMLPRITYRERDTILAALRAWQATPRARLGFYPVATNGGQVSPLTEAEIDELCQRLSGEKRA